MHKENNQSISKPHDAFWKANLSDPKRMKKLIQTHLPKAVVAQMALNTLVQKPTEFIQTNLRTVASDVLYAVQMNNKPAYIYTLWEHQSTPEELMAFRMLLYVIEIMKWHLAQGYKKLPVVLTSVVYHGKQSPYPYSTDLAACFEDVEFAKKYSLAQFNLVDLTIMPEENLKTLDPTLFFEYILKHSRAKLVDDIMQVLTKNPAQANYFLNAGKNLLNQIFYYLEAQEKDNAKINDLIQVINQSTKGEFMSYLERLEKTAENKGVQSGIAQGIEKGAISTQTEIARNLLIYGDQLDKVAHVTGLDESILKKMQSEMQQTSH